MIFIYIYIYILCVICCSIRPSSMSYFDHLSTSSRRPQKRRPADAQQQQGHQDRHEALISPTGGPWHLRRAPGWEGPGRGTNVERTTEIFDVIFYNIYIYMHYTILYHLLYKVDKLYCKLQAKVRYNE